MNIHRLKTSCLRIFHSLTYIHCKTHNPPFASRTKDQKGGCLKVGYKTEGKQTFPCLKFVAGALNYLRELEEGVFMT